MNTDRWKYSQLPQSLLHFSSCCGWNPFLMAFTSKKWFLYLVSSNLFSIPNLHSLRKLKTNWYSVNKMSLPLLIVSHCSTPKIRELLFSMNDAAPVRREGWGIKIPEVILHQWKATFVSSSEPQTLLGAVAVAKPPRPRGSSQPQAALPEPSVPWEHTHFTVPQQCRAATQAATQQPPLSSKNPQGEVTKLKLICKLVSDSEKQEEAAPAPTQTEFILPHLGRDVVFFLSCF